MPDFSQPGSDGPLAYGFEPSGFKKWRYGTVYTVRPEMLSQLASGREYRLIAAIRRKIAKHQEVTSYSDLYQLVTAVVSSRIAELECAAWIVSHAWGSKDLGASRFAFASVTMGLARAQQGKHGENAPSQEALTAPFEFKLEPPTSWSYDEFFNIFDFWNPKNTQDEIGMFSYGEFATPTEGIGFEPFIQRAEARAKLHHALLEGEQPLHVVRREWFCASDPAMVVVHIYYPVSRRALE